MFLHFIHRDQDFTSRVLLVTFPEDYSHHRILICEKKCSIRYFVTNKFFSLLLLNVYVVTFYQIKLVCKCRLIKKREAM